MAECSKKGQDDLGTGKHTLWHDNPFAHHLLSELLGGVFVGLDARDAGEALQRWQNDSDQLTLAVCYLHQKERQRQQKPSTEDNEGSDDLFDFVSMDDEVKEDTGEVQTEQDESPSWMGEVDFSRLPRSIESYLASSAQEQAAYFISVDSTSLQDARRALLADVEGLHQDASKEALDLVFKFVHKLSEFIAKDAQTPSLLHPSRFKRMVLTGLQPPLSGPNEGTVDCHLFTVLFKLAFSFSDEMRIRVVELLLMMSRVPLSYSLPLEKCLVERPTLLVTKGTSLAIYDAAYSVDRWAPALGRHTFSTLTFPMKIKEAEALVHHYQALHLGTQLLNEHIRVLGELERKLQAIIESEDFGGRAFVKISTRSPKDVVFHLPKFETTLRQVAEDWMSRYGLSEPMPESVQQALMQRCGALCMSVTSGAEAVEMLKSSKRIWVDLKEALDTPANDFTIKVVVREWMDIPNAFELRGFVRNRRLVALTQYFSMCYFPWITLDDWRHAKDRVLSFFETTVAPLLPMDDCVCDFVVCEDRVMVIELNLFGRTAGAALFSWDADQQTLYGNRPFEFRVVADADLSPVVVD